MPANRNALIRYKTIDACLQNRFRKWTLDDLIEAVSDALYEYEGIHKGVSKRTVQADIQMMRSDKLGYNAPIVVHDKKYYTYADPEYSITNIPLSQQDLQKMAEAVELLKQFKGFSHFRELGGMVQKLEDHVYAQKAKQPTVIDFEKNDYLKGLEWLDLLYQAIVQKRTVLLTYQSFKARQPQTFPFYPVLLKEFRNRWFVIGTRAGKEIILNLALDRIEQLAFSPLPFEGIKDFSEKNWFEHTIGVSVLPDVPPQKVVLQVAHHHAPYLLTKPLHHSQREINRNAFGVTIALEVQHNFELEKDLLAMGESVRVIEPPTLKRNIRKRLKAALENYQTELTTRGLTSATNQLHNQGIAVLHPVFSSRDIRGLQRLLNDFFPEHTATQARYLLSSVQLQQANQLLFTENMQLIQQQLLPDKTLQRVYYWHTIPKNSDWQQTDDSAWVIYLYLKDLPPKQLSLEVLPRSQRKVFNKEEKKLLDKYANAHSLSLHKGGIHVLHAALMRRWAGNNNNASFLELWFA